MTNRPTWKSVFFPAVLYILGQIHLLICRKERAPPLPSDSNSKSHSPIRNTADRRMHTNHTTAGNTEENQSDLKNTLHVTPGLTSTGSQRSKKHKRGKQQVLNSTGAAALSTGGRESKPGLKCIKMKDSGKKQVNYCLLKTGSQLSLLSIINQ